MSKFMRVVTLEAAKATLNKKWRAEPRDVVVPVSGSVGQVNSADVISKIDVPPFERATYDGYAVIASDTFGAAENSPVEIKLVGRIMAGTWPKIRLKKGSCAEISTGAPLPKGPDAVVMSEYAVAKDKKLVVYRAVSPGENVSQRGSDIKKGQVVMKRLKRITKIDIAVLAAVGVKKIKVRRRPKVAIISSGSELVKPGEKLKPGKIYDVNSSSLIEAVRACGAEPIFIGIAPDVALKIKAAVSKGLKVSDIVLISGGTSVGAGDISPKVIDGMGRPGVIVHGLSMKPGKPALIAVVNKKPIFGLPGYPVSALMVFDQLVADYLHELSGVLREKLYIVRAKLASRVLSSRGRRELVPVKLIEKDGQHLAEPILKGSGAITSLSTADGYIEVPLERELVEEGENVEVKLFEGLRHD
ncbi:MAG: gephyrin-like molybdotransferase Glp [Methanobacteriota archaeon]